MKKSGYALAELQHIQTLLQKWTSGKIHLNPKELHNLQLAIEELRPHYPRFGLYLARLIQSQM